LKNKTEKPVQFIMMGTFEIISKIMQDSGRVTAQVLRKVTEIRDFSILLETDASLLKRFLFMELVQFNILHFTAIYSCLLEIHALLGRSNVPEMDQSCHRRFRVYCFKCD
jgi:hypothetical protein